MVQVQGYQECGTSSSSSSSTSSTSSSSIGKMQKAAKVQLLLYDVSNISGPDPLVSYPLVV